MFRKFIVWTGKHDTVSGKLWPSCSIGSCMTMDEAESIGKEWQERVQRNYPGRRAGHCVVTTYGEQKIVASIPEVNSSLPIAPRV